MPKAIEVKLRLPPDPAAPAKQGPALRSLSQRAPRPQGAKPVPLTRAMTVGRAFAAGARSCLAQMRANEPSARLGEDIEGVHQLRVGLRRLRSLVGAFRPVIAADFHGGIAAELDWLQQQLGPARDWDVFIGETLGRLERHLPGDPAIAAMRRAAGSLRAEGYALLRTTLDLPRYTELLRRLELALADGSWAGPAPGGPLEQPVVAMAGALLAKRHRKLRRLGGKRADLPEAELHRLRLAAKKLRYLADIFRALYPRKTMQRYLDAVTAVQDQLGSLNDALVGQSLLPLLEQRIAEQHGVEPALRAVGLVRGWQAARIEQDLGRFRPVWRAFREQRPGWAKGGDGHVIGSRHPRPRSGRGSG